MARIPFSDDACDRLVAARDPIDAGRVCDQPIAAVSRRLRDELLAELPDELPDEPAARRRRRRGSGAGRRRLAAAAVLAALVVVGVLAMIGSLPAGGVHDGTLDVPAASAAVVPGWRSRRMRAGSDARARPASRESLAWPGQNLLASLPSLPVS